MPRYIVYGYGLPEFPAAIITAVDGWTARKEYARLKKLEVHQIVAIREDLLGPKEREQFADLFAPIPRPGELFKEVK